VIFVCARVTLWGYEGKVDVFDRRVRIVDRQVSKILGESDRRIWKRGSASDGQKTIPQLSLTSRGTQYDNMEMLIDRTTELSFQSFHRP
jgi:hypothetical protein